jgi:hypothetical protein
MSKQVKAPGPSGIKRQAKTQGKKQGKTPQPPQSGGASETEAPKSSGSMFRRVEPLHPERHGDLRLLPGADFSFASSLVQAPVTLQEIGLCCRNYVVAFKAAPGAPRLVALLGVSGRGNVFLEPSGAWKSGCYVPAAVRRYPFTLMETPDKAKLILAIDAGSDRISGKMGQKLFEAGKPSAIVQEASAFLKRLQAQSKATDAFVSALADKQIFKPGRLAFKKPDGKQYIIDGLLIADEKKLHDLPNETVADWHRKGWLAAIHFHLLSLGNSPALIGAPVKPD